VYITACRSTRNQRGTIAEFGPALFIGFLVMFFIIGFGFYICGVATAYFACSLAAREGATGGSRGQITTAATTAASRVANGAFGQFARLRAPGGGNFTNSLRVQFFEVNPATGVATEFVAGNVNPALFYQVRVGSNYQLTIPFMGDIRGSTASDNVVDHAEALAVN